MHLAALTEHKTHHSIQITTRELSEMTGLVPSALSRAIKQLCDPARGFVTIRRGNTRTASAYLCNFLATVRSASFREALPKEALPPNPLLFEKHSATFGEALPTDSTPFTFPAPRVDELPSLRPIVDRVLTSRSEDHDKGLLLTFRRYLHQYMQKLGIDGAGQPTPLAHPPDDKVVAQFLAIGEPHRLGALLSDLMNERQRAYNYAWFVTTGLQRIAGVSFRETRAARETLKLVKRGPAAPAPPAQPGELFGPERTSTEGLVRQAITGVKNLR